MRTLYLSHDGVLDPLGQSQVLPYLLGLSGADRRITLLTFEKPRALADRPLVERVRQRCAAAHIQWVPLRYHRWPPVVATCWDIARGVWTAARIARRERVQLVHARSYVPALMAWWVKRLCGVRWLFDMRGFWADERIDGGIWRRRGWLYALAKRWERRFLTDAEAVVSLTERGRQELARLPYLQARRPSIDVIPTCVDLARFAPQPPSETLLDRHGLRGKWCVLFHGSLGSWYLLDEMLAFFRRLTTRAPAAHLILLVPGQEALARQAAQRAGVRPTECTITAAPHAEMPQWLSLAQAGVLFIKPAWSKRASCPTKLGELLACGVPVVINEGIGDSGELVRRERVGVVIPRCDDVAYEVAAARLLELTRDPDVRARCRGSAERFFALEAGVARYRQLYQRLCPADPAASVAPSHAG